MLQTPMALASDVGGMEEVARGIYVIQGPHEQMSASNHGAIGNAGFIIGQEAVAVIDPGGSLLAGEQLKQAILTITDLPIDYLILTHFHPDHVVGAMAFAQTPNIIAHQNYARAMTQRAQFYIDRFSDFLPATVEQAFRKPTQSVNVGQTIDLDLGNRPIAIEAFPLAHTDNDLTIHDEQTNTFWASDLVFAQRTPSLDGSLNGWLEVLAELDNRGYALTVPGHGQPENWEDIITSQKNYLIELRSSVRKLIAEETPLSEVMRAHEEQQFTDWPWRLYAVQHGSNLAKAYTELEWE